MPVAFGDGTLRARPTLYAGTEMRSRLEAGFAQWLDSQPWGKRHWEYEGKAYASDAGQYLPDFTVRHGHAAVVYEVKPASINEGDLISAFARMHVVLSSEPDAGLMVMLGDYKDGKHHFRSSFSCFDDKPCEGPWCKRPRVPTWRRGWEGCDPDGNEAGLNCPLCHCAQMHLTDTVPYLGGSDSHRKAVALHFECEDGCKTVLHITNWKGDTLLTWERAEA